MSSSFLRLHLARTAKCASRSALQSARAPARLHDLQLRQSSLPLAWSVGSSRAFSWNPWSTSSKATVVSPSTPSPPQVLENPADLKPLSTAEQVVQSTSPDALPHASSESASEVASSASEAGSSIIDSVTGAIDNATIALASNPIPTQYGDMAALGLVSWTPAGIIPWVLELTQVSTGLPWWATIIAVTVGARTALLPLIVKSSRMQGKLAPLQPRIAEIKDKMNDARAKNDTMMIQQLTKQQMSLLRNAGVNPLSSMMTAVAQIAVQFGFFIGLRRMCTTPVEQLATGGFGWMTDLTAADPLYIMPALNLVLIQLQLQVSQRDMLATGSPQAPHILNGLRVFSVLGAYWLALFPAGLNLHLVTSIAFIVLQTLLLRLPAIRRTLALPPVPPLPDRKLPSIRDSLKELKNWYSVRMKEAQLKEIERQRKMRMVQRQMTPPGRK